MDMIANDLTGLPGWVALAIIILDRGIIPLLNKLLPFKQAKDKLAHDVLIEEKQHERDLEERLVKVMESTAQNLGRLIDQNIAIQSTQNQILITQNEQSKALAVLVDRVARDDTNPTRTRKAVK